MYKKIIEFLKEHLDEIILLIGVILISLLSFAMGYIIAKQQEKEPIRIEYNPNLRIHPNAPNKLLGEFGYNSDIGIIL